ncbi:hypothetical protein [Zooshikella harenae]|uniref:Uncharacterized protein n=1 Tax=Zooshikella harenae TaxID=2827238 RepID=A0ABS5ZD27_9GAMM|nr:hypothetical protein [Zooshikella harenae]MBU2711971.1 hypothetical protein [Zooshikella harenae]
MYLWFIIVIHSFNSLLESQTEQHDFVCHHLYKSQVIKKQLVSVIWVIASVFIINCPLLPIIIIIALSATFLGFMILDETE